MATDNNDQITDVASGKLCSKTQDGVLDVRIISDDSDDEIDLRELVHELWKSKFFIIAVTVVSLVAGVSFVRLSPDKWKATKEVAVANPSSEGIMRLAGLVRSIGVADIKLPGVLWGVYNRTVTDSIDDERLTLAELSINSIKGKKGVYELQLIPRPISQTDEAEGRGQTLKSTELKAMLMDYSEIIARQAAVNYLEQVQLEVELKKEQLQEDLHHYEVIMKEQLPKVAGSGSVQVQLPAEYLQMKVEQRRLLELDISKYLTEDFIALLSRDIVDFAGDDKIELKNGKLRTSLAMVLFTLLGGFAGVMIVLFRKVL